MIDCVEYPAWNPLEMSESALRKIDKISHLSLELVEFHEDYDNVKEEQDYYASELIY